MSHYVSSLILKAKHSLSPETKDKLKEYRYKIGSFFLAAVEPLIGRFVTLHTRPIYRNGIQIDDAPAFDYSEYAIVMQGPIISKYDFTYETFGLYKHYYPKATLILSTWKGENEKLLERIRQSGVEVVLSEKPKDQGPRNINMQITSAVAGLTRAQALKKRYAVKTRTEARLYERGTLAYFTDLLLTFPLPALTSRQKGRLISTHSSIFKRYFFSDMLVFGYTEDVLVYFNAPLLPKETRTLQFKDTNVPFVPEQYFFSEFLKQAGWVLADTEEDSLRAQAERVVVTDPSSVDWYWFKYDRHREYRHLSYRRKKRIMGFAEWLRLYRTYRLPRNLHL